MKNIVFYIVLFCAFIGLKAQKLTLNGYVKDMQGLYYLGTPIALTSGESFQWTTYNQIHNRLNLEFQPVDNLRFEMGVRNRLLAGKLIGDIPGYGSIFEMDNGLVDLSWNLVEKNNWFLNTSTRSYLCRLHLEKCSVKSWPSANQLGHKPRLESQRSF